MDKKTYEALKRLVRFYHDNDMRLLKGDMKLIEKWIKGEDRDNKSKTRECKVNRGKLTASLNT